jgi:N-acetylmuramoyl-L-alanine amidase
MKIVISSGHAKYVRGASGYPVPPQLDEVDEARRVVDTVADVWRQAGVDVETFHDDVSTSQGENLDRIVDFHNAQGAHDLDVSVHFNAFDSVAHGVEVLYVSDAGKTIAKKVSDAIAAVGFTNRGAKERGDLAFLNGTNETAILIETCFCDNTSDSNKYNSEFDAVCVAIAESAAGIETEKPPERPEMPERPERPERPELPTGDNRVDITATAVGQVLITFNGSPVYGAARCANVLNIDMAAHGDLTVTINGQEFHNWESAEDQNLQRDIFATTYGGEADNEHSAYPPYDSDGQGPYLNDTDLYVAVPWAVDDAAVRERGIRVYYRPSGKSAVGKIMDKGPWMIDDNYPETGTRPIAETCFKDKTELPRGPNAGKVPSNPAGIDLSPGMFKALDMEDNDEVDWEFVEPETV